MPNLTDGEIRRALKQVEQTGKQLSLVDGEGHGTGRLVLVMKPIAPLALFVMAIPREDLRRGLPIRSNYDIPRGN